MCIKLTPEDLALARPVDMNYSKHLAVVNGIWSYEKELIASKTLHEEGGVLCTAVAIFVDGAKVLAIAAKRVLYLLCREWKLCHDILTVELLAKRDTPDIRAYLKCLEYQISGNEIWSRTAL
jgi:aristolochene synthase